MYSRAPYSKMPYSRPYGVVEVTDSFSLVRTVFIYHTTEYSTHRVVSKVIDSAHSLLREITSAKAFQLIREISLFFLPTTIRGKYKRDGDILGIYKREGDMTGRLKRK